MTEIFHSVKAYLYDNALTSDPDDYVARVNSERSLSSEEICESAVSRGGADISQASMLHGTNLFFKEMAYQLCNGYSVNTGYFTATPLIRGVFNSPDDTFDPERHTILFQFNQGDTLRNELSTIEVQIMGVADTGLGISQVTDMKTGSVNDQLTPGRNLRIDGHKLKVAGENENTGIFFINQSSEEETKVDASDLIINNPSELLIIIPELGAGTYKLKVSTQYAKGQFLKEPRTAIFDKELTVQ